MTNCEEASKYYNDLAKAKKLSLIQNVNLVWHTNEFNQPKNGTYLCYVAHLKCFTKNNVVVAEPSKYYYSLRKCINGLWNGQDVVVAWAELPECKFRLGEE